MQNYIIKGALSVALLTMMSAFAATKAQTPSDLEMSISVNPSTVSRGGTVGVFALVKNTTSSRLRATVTLDSLSPCGTRTLGSNKLDLQPGQAIQVTVSYPIPADACLGMYQVSISEKSGGGGRRSSLLSGAFASTSLMVQ